jgi:hypothetical protein
MRHMLWTERIEQLLVLAPAIALTTSTLAASKWPTSTAGLLTCGLYGTSCACDVAAIGVDSGAIFGTDDVDRFNIANGISNQGSILTHAGWTEDGGEGKHCNDLNDLHGLYIK